MPPTGAASSEYSERHQKWNHQMANDFVIRVSACGITKGSLPRVVPASCEPDHDGVGKVVPRFDPYANVPRVARSFEDRYLKDPR